MKFKLVIDSVSPEIEVLIVTEIINAEDRNGIDIIREKGIKGNACLYDKDKKLLAEGTNEINRYLARTINTALYGGTCPRDKTEVDHWMLFAIEKFADISKIKDNLNHLNRILITRTWLVNKRLTLADIYIFCALLNQEYIKHYGENYDNITRWYKHVQSLRVVKNALHMIVKDVENYISEAKNIMPEKEKSVTKQTKTKKQEGKFIDLPGAEMGKVVVRFPPEASGYLHIGHAKAALLNQYYAETFQGMLIMRFDDTNPAKETVEFEEAILQDLKLLQIKPHKFTHTSDYFEILEEYCTTLIVDGKAFVDDTPAHIMKEQRDKRLKSENRDNSVKKNFQLWQEMRNGTKKGLECCVRAKIDYESTNGCMRDPTIYRCKLEPHPCTGYKHKVYPTYDFACPTVDVIEHVTHTLRTTEYHDRDAQFYWILEALGLRHRPHIWEYSRLNMTYTVLSKRKLTWFVNEGLVDGWDDPRFPTVRGILRRGMTVEGLKHFIIAQGSSKSVVFMEWDKIWAFNKKVIDPVAIRYTALDYDNMVTVNIIDAQEGSLDVQNHPKDPSKGTKRVRICSKVLIERDDAKALVVGQNATFINWGNLMIEKIDMDQSGNIVDVKARLNLTDNNYKNTLKITWIAAPLDKEVVSLEDATELNPIPCYAVYFNHIMNVSVLGKDDDFKDFVAKDTRKEVKMWGEVELKRVKKGEIIQLQRKGFFICDVPYAPTSLYSLREQPLILFHIPDGHTTTSSVTTSAVSLKQQRDVVQHKIACEKTVESKKKLAWNSDIKSTKEVNLPLLQNLEDYERGIDKTRSLLLDIIQYQENKIKQLKSVYKEITGQDWEQIQITSTDTVSNTKIKAISEQLNKQINKMQNLVNSKADKSIIDKEMKIFLSSANDYQNAIDREWKLTEITAADSVSNTKTKEISQTKEMSKKMQNHLRVLENIIDRETKNLSNLKAEYQSVTGQNSKPSQITTAASSDTTSKDLKEAEMSEEIKKQGDILRILKSSKADKSIIDKEVKILLNLKNDYKNATGQDWKPSQITTAASSDTTSKATLKEAEISEEIKKQGDTVRNLKISKADKSIIDREVKILLSLKNDYKNATGQDWKPSQITTTASSDTTSEETSKGVEISEEIRKQGDKVRNLKSSKADKSIIDREVKILLSLKNDYKNATGQDWKPSQITTAASSDTTSKDLKEAEMSEEIKKQGDILRNLKSSKADKSIIDREVKILSSLKNDYKNATGKDWKPSQITTAASSDTTSKDTLKEAEISEKIEKQGDKVRNLKSSKADKSIIDREVKILLSLKNDYKNATDQDWKPSQITTVASSDTTSKDTLKGVEISEEIKKQGDKVRNLKSSKADKSIIDREVKILLSLKNDYKNATGQDWKPSQITTAASSDTTSKDTLKEAEISEEIKKQGDKVRNLKSSKADKSIIDREVKILLSLKNDYKNATDQDWKPASNLEVSKKKKEDASKPGKMLQKEIAKSATSKDIDANKTGTRLGLEAKKEENFFDWYSQVITKSGMIEYYDVSGCYILRPWSFAIWKIIKEYIDKEITALGVQECYFPMFVTRGVLEKEKAHIADFAPEVAWVTKCGESDLAEPIAIRPTSETVMYPAYAKWLRSDTELPLRLNQWNNVVRWEFKDPKPFLRTREFLWQEGHTAFATKAEAEEEVLIILDMYAKVYEHLLAIPVIKGRKTEKEKFAGGDYTTTVEAFISTSGRAIQGATSHHLGQNFSKMFSIQLEGVAEGDEKTFIYQNSWGLTTRTIGVMIMVHGDDKGLVLPPHVASIQGIVIPCGVTANMSTTEKELLQSECVKLVDELSKDGKFRVKGDFRNNRTPGWKFNHWELKGVPVRIELGPKDMEKNQVTFVRRDNLQKITAERKMVAIALDCLLKDIQAQLFYRAKENLTAHIKQVENWTDFGTELNKKNLLLSPFCGEPTCEDNIKADSAREDSGDELGTLSMGAKGLCIPFEQPKLTKPLDRLKCIHHSCKNKVKFYTLFGRSY